MLIKLTQAFVKVTGAIPQIICFRKKIYYEDRAVQSRSIKGPAIIISNHRSLYDFAIMMFVFPARILRCQVAEVMYKKRFTGTLLRWLGSIKVDRNSYDFSFLSESEAILRRGGVVEIYPESRLPRPDEERPLEFKPSAAYLALVSGAPVIPVYTNGSYFNKNRARVIIGKPILASDYVDESLSDRENIARVNDVLRQKIISLEEQLNEQTKEKTV